MGDFALYYEEYYTTYYTQCLDCSNLCRINILDSDGGMVTKVKMYCIVCGKTEIEGHEKGSASWFGNRIIKKITNKEEP